MTQGLSNIGWSWPSINKCHTKTQKSTLAGRQTRENEIAYSFSNLTPIGETLFRVAQPSKCFCIKSRPSDGGAWWKPRSGADAFAEINGYVSAYNRGKPPEVKTESLIRKSPTESSGGGGEWGEGFFRRQFKVFYGQGRRGDCRLDLEGVKLFLLPPLSFILAQSGVLGSSKKCSPCPSSPQGDVQVSVTLGGQNMLSAVLCYDCDDAP